MPRILNFYTKIIVVFRFYFSAFFFNFFFLLLFWLLSISLYTKYNVIYKTYTLYVYIHQSSVWSMMFSAFVVVLYFASCTLNIKIIVSIDDNEQFQHLMYVKIFLGSINCNISNDCDFFSSIFQWAIVILLKQMFSIPENLSRFT